MQFQQNEGLLKQASPNGDEMLVNGKAPLPGQIMKLTNLAKTFRSVAEHGRNGFYKGRVAEAIVEVIQSKGGVMELEDLAKHDSTFVEPIHYTYGGGVTVYEVSINGIELHGTDCRKVPSQWPRQILTLNLLGGNHNDICLGITALLALGIIESLQEQGVVKPLLEMEHNSVQYLHTLIEALRYYLFYLPLNTTNVVVCDSSLAFSGLFQLSIIALSSYEAHLIDSQYYVTDPDMEYVPVKELLSKACFY
jgi:gamma-glutamyltranspeptidase/glutathione hydrolase